MKDVMIDLETLGTQPGSVILSIGAVLFDPKQPVDTCVGSRFYAVINQASCIDAGLKTDPNTVKWWEGQSEDARKVLTESIDMTASAQLFSTLQMLSRFVKEDMRVWSNGAAFDQPLLDVAYNAVGLPLPWKYWNSRCYRTITNLHPNRKEMEPQTVLAHNALEDAIWQAKHMVAIVQDLGINI